MEQTNLNPDGSYWQKTTPWGEPFVVGRSYLFEGKYWVYAGDFNSSSEVPNMICCYTIGDQIKIKEKLKIMPAMQREKIKRKRVDDSRPINTEITDQDGTLMGMMKTALEKRDITRGKFKQLYENDSDMNNCLRTIEAGGSLSWGRFEDLSTRMNAHLRLEMYDDNGVICSVDTGSGSEKPKKKKK